VGTDKWAAICSDSTIVTKNARRDIVVEIPTMLDLCDVCHHLHNTIKNVTILPEFEGMLLLLKAIIKHFSNSTISVAHLRTERRVDNNDKTVNALQKIGKTRFGSHWAAAVSLEQCLSNVRSLVERKINRKVQEMFLNRRSFKVMEQDLSVYITIVGPFVRSLWALEASHANASDVFVFWLAIAATLEELFGKGEDESGIPASLVRRITAIFNRRWKEFFTNDVYFVAFALDPRL
ncbi:hypothetical protein M405DRAFT_746027, partial [Rhizopogon salebrosus TDB-379]